MSARLRHIDPIALAAGLAGLCAVLYVTFTAFTSPLVDFGNIWAASNSFVHGRPPYAETTVGGGFVHLPLSVILNVPYTLLSETRAAQLNALVNAVCIVAGLAIAARAQGSSPQAAAVMLLIVSLSKAFTAEVSASNADGIAVLFLALSLLAVRRDRLNWAGICVALALSLKPTFVLFALVPALVSWSWRPLLIAAIASIGLNLLAMLLIVDGSRFISSVLPFLAGGHTYGYNLSLKAAGERAGDFTTLVAAVRVGCLLAAGWFVFTFRVYFRDHVGWLVLTMLAITPLVSSYFLLYYLVYVVLAVGVLDEMNRSRWTGLLGLVAFLWLSPTVLRATNHTLDDVAGFRTVVGAVVVLGVSLRVARSSATGVTPAFGTR